MIKIINICIFIIFITEFEAQANKFIFTGFTPYSYHQILSNHKGSELTMVFWSINCPPCLKELKTISEKKLHLINKFIFISTDNEEPLKNISFIINKFNLAKQEHWIFKGGQVENIINSIDKAWYGEVPRNYYFNRKHQRKRIEIKED